MLITSRKVKKKHTDLIEFIYKKATKVLKLPDYLEVNIGFVSKSKIRKINKKHRNVNKVTDVLSFPTLLPHDQVGMGLVVDRLTKEKFPFDINYETGNIFIGDVYICIPKVKRQAKEYGHSFERELSYLSLHGLLHLLGYDHMVEEDKRVMREMEEKILAEEI